MTRTLLKNVTFKDITKECNIQFMESSVSFKKLVNKIQIKLRALKKDINGKETFPKKIEF